MVENVSFIVDGMALENKGRELVSTADEVLLKGGGGTGGGGGGMTTVDEGEGSKIVVDKRERDEVKGDGVNKDEDGVNSDSDEELKEDKEVDAV